LIAQAKGATLAEIMTPQQAESREELRKLLDRPSGGVIFTWE
jgi:type I site-specific restriction-modification system R (restriction) subunit